MVRNNQLDHIEDAVPNYNLNEVDAWDGELHSVDEGDYEWEVAETKWRASSGGKPEFLVVLVVVGNSDGTESEMAGRRVYQRYYATPKAIKRLKAFVIAVGAEIDATGRFAPDDVVGTHLLARAVKETWMGVDPETGRDAERISTKIQGERPLPSAAVAPVASPRESRAEAAMPPPAPAPAAPISRLYSAAAPAAPAALPRESAAPRRGRPASRV